MHVPVSSLKKKNLFKASFHFLNFFFSFLKINCISSIHIWGPASWISWDRIGPWFSWPGLKSANLLLEVWMDVSTVRPLGGLEGSLTMTGVAGP